MHVSAVHTYSVCMYIAYSVSFTHPTLTTDLSLWELHGSMDQAERKEVYKTFCEATSGALLCTVSVPSSP